MTRTTNSRIAGFTFLFYIAVGMTSLNLYGRATSGEGVAAKLAGIAQHATSVRFTVLLDLLGCLSALVLAVTLYALTREQDRDLAMLGLTCRVGEGLIGATASEHARACSRSRRRRRGARRRPPRPTRSARTS